MILESEVTELDLIVMERLNDGGAIRPDQISGQLLSDYINHEQKIYASAKGDTVPGRCVNKDILQQIAEAIEESDAKIIVEAIRTAGLFPASDVIPLAAAGRKQLNVLRQICADCINDCLNDYDDCEHFRLTGAI